MNPFIVGAGLVTLNRLMSSRADISEETKELVLGATEALDEISLTVGDLAMDRPSSWLGFARRLIRRSIGESNQSHYHAWLSKQGYGRHEERMPALWISIWRHAPREIVFRENSTVIWRIDLGGHAIMVPMDSGDSFEPVAQFESIPTIHLPSNETDLQATLRAVARAFWRGQSAVMLDRVGSQERFVEVRQSDVPYLGDLVHQVDLWRRYREAGLRRCVLLQGRPGTGKSTFTREAARRLSKRTIVLTPRAIEDINTSDWAFLLDVLAPEMIIVDDIDRLGSFTLEGRLSMFEEGHCNVPYILFTSNDHLRIPQAMRRPGRIDQIIEVEEPDDEACRRIVHALARRIGVEVPQDRIQQLSTLAKGLSNAHLVEMLRRARVEGWDRTPLENDITFGTGFDEGKEDDDVPPPRSIRRRPHP